MKLEFNPAPPPPYITLKIPYYFRWHYARGNTTIRNLEDREGKFISPILFVDGRAGSYDFTTALTAEPDHPTEQTKDWMWYKEAMEATRMYAPQK